MRKLSSSAIVTALLMLTVAPGPMSGQDIKEIRLEGPTATFSEGFGSITGFRELPDGRVLVSDGLGQALVVADLDGGAADTLGGIGAGPREYRTPDALFALPDDETLFLDLGNGRLTRLGSDLSFGETMPVARQPPESSTIEGLPRIGLIVIPQGVDADGRIYFQQVGMGLDSAAIYRSDGEVSEVESVGKIKLEERKREESGGPNNRSVMVRPVPYSAQDAWAVASDGRVAVARADGYRVEWILPDGGVVNSGSTDYDPVRIRQAEKEEYFDEQAANSLSISVSIDNGQRRTSFGRGGGGNDEPDYDAYEWPDAKPAFRTRGVAVSASGDAWVDRHVPAGEPRVFDVFGADGSLKAQVVLPENRQLVGFGDGTVYLRHVDEYDFHWLERYDLPRS